MQFDLAALAKRLEKLGRSARLLFAALCAERLMAGYHRFEKNAGWGESSLLDECIHACYSAACGENPPLEASRLMARCQRAIPSSEEFTGPLVNHAQNCAIAVAYSLGVLKLGSSELAAYSAQKVIETCDSYVVRILGLAEGVFDSSKEAVIGGHELVQRELNKQDVDILQISTRTVDRYLVDLMRTENLQYSIPFNQSLQ